MRVKEPEGLNMMTHKQSVKRGKGEIKLIGFTADRLKISYDCVFSHLKHNVNEKEKQGLVQFIHS